MKVKLMALAGPHNFQLLMVTLIQSFFMKSTISWKRPWEVVTRWTSPHIYTHAQARDTDAEYRREVCGKVLMSETALLVVVVLWHQAVGTGGATAERAPGGRLTTMFSNHINVT